MLYNIIVFVSLCEERPGGVQRSKLPQNKELLICLACSQVLSMMFKPILSIDVNHPRN